MPTLYVLSGPEIGRQFDVSDGAVVGRADDCDAVLRHLSISRRHARLEHKRAGWRIVDLGSRNGVFLDGARTKKLFVEDGTEFRLGDIEVRLRFAPGEAEAEADADAASGPSTDPSAELASGMDETLVRPRPPLDEPSPAASPDPTPASEPDAPIEDDFEFADETPVAAPAPRATVTAEPELEDPDEITLEEPDEIELESDPIPARSSAPAAPAPQPKRAAIPPNKPSAAARAGIAPPAKSGGAQDPARKALQYHRVETQGGFLSADLGQYPSWVRFVALAVALVLFAGLFLLAFRAAGSM